MRFAGGIPAEDDAGSFGGRPGRVACGVEWGSPLSCPVIRVGALPTGERDLFLVVEAISPLVALSLIGECPTGLDISGGSLNAGSTSK